MVVQMIRYWIIGLAFLTVLTVCGCLTIFIGYNGYLLLFKNVATYESLIGGVSCLLVFVYITLQIGYLATYLFTPSFEEED